MGGPQAHEELLTNFPLTPSPTISPQAFVAQAGGLLAQAGEAGVVQVGVDDALAVGGLGQDQAPGVDDKGTAVALFSRGVLAVLGRGDDIGLIFYGPGPEQGFPVVRAGGPGKGRGGEEEGGAPGGPGPG